MSAFDSATRCRPYRHRLPSDRDVFIEGKSDSDVADSNSRNSDKTIEFNATITRLRASCWKKKKRMLLFESRYHVGHQYIIISKI